MGHQVKYKVYLMLHLSSLAIEEYFEIMLIEYQLTNLFHFAKLT